ncbi:MAG: nicotinate-nucleotide--dimethylbenzimidazole phosphoribosyltransferase [Catenulispora sp.]
MPQQRDSNADSGPAARRSPGARGAEALRQAQQFDVFRRDPVVPQQASPSDGNDFDDAADRTQPPQQPQQQPREGRGQVDISVFDAGGPPERPGGFDLRSPLPGASYDQPTDIIPAVVDNPGRRDDSFGRRPGPQNADPRGFAGRQQDERGFGNAPGYGGPQDDEQDFGNAPGFEGQQHDQQGFGNAPGFGGQQHDERSFGNAPGYGDPQHDEQSFGQQGFDQQGFDQQAFDQQGFDQQGFDQQGFGNAGGFDGQQHEQQGFGSAPGFGGPQHDDRGFGNPLAFGDPQHDEQGFGQQGFPPAGADPADQPRAGFRGPQGFPPRSGGEQPEDQQDFRPQGDDEPVFSFPPPAPPPFVGQQQGSGAHGFSDAIDPAATFGGPMPVPPRAGSDPSFNSRPAFPSAADDADFPSEASTGLGELRAFGPNGESPLAGPVFGPPEGGLPSFGDQPLTANTAPGYGLPQAPEEQAADSPFPGAHFDPPRFEPAPPVFDDPAEGTEFAQNAEFAQNPEFAPGGEDPGPVFPTPTVAITPAEPYAEYPEADAPAAEDDDADGDAEPEMLVPWAAPAETADPADGLAAESDLADPYDENLDPDDGAPRVPPYDDAELAAVHRVIRERRDVRSTFLADPIPDEVLTRVLEAAHTAPSVGFSQPWDFLVLRSRQTRLAVHELAARQRDAYSASLPKARQRAFKDLKIEAILDTPVNIVVTCDPTRGGRHTLGRHTQPQMAPYSAALAVENLWLAARAEGLGVGWVSFFDERELTRTLDLPDHLTVVAYLCVGYVREFPDEPELSGAGWAKRRPLAWAVHEEQYGRRALPGSHPVSLLDETLAAIGPLDEVACKAALDRQAAMTKPAGSLGVLEDVSVQLAGLAGVCPPPVPEPAAVAVFAADHGVHAQGVTPWPQEVTAQMVRNFLAGGAVVNAFAHQIGAEVCVVDVGVNADLAQQTGLIPRKIRYGTADLAEGPAMSREEALAALEVGVETARDLVAAGNKVLLTGDMGIANTTASAALIAAFTGASPTQVTGYGTGIDEQTYAHKVDVVRRALDLHRPDPADPLGVLAAVGGLEHAALAGFILGAASLRTPVILDGVIAGAAALVAQALAPDATAAMVAGHRSAESGHQLALEALAVTPLIDLELRLGEGSGAVLALPLVQAAVRALRDVATFESAGVAERSESEDENAA